MNSGRLQISNNFRINNKLKIEAISYQKTCEFLKSMFLKNTGDKIESYKKHFDIS
ncbi:hypothetical protein [Metamycoplasma hyosynoviae]|uniref:hypothetical protein n=1 Tax=Metamycoplasma hyosynoviae TaxID=29559 RepID=UPI000B1D1361|nr:hypothetical protein [Metamycoplasma hyosynoviae]